MFSYGLLIMGTPMLTDQQKVTFINSMHTSRELVKNNGQLG